MRMGMSELRKLVEWQAEDDGLWFKATTAPEAYLQQELRKLHAAIEAAAQAAPAQEPVAPSADEIERAFGKWCASRESGKFWLVDAWNAAVKWMSESAAPAPAVAAQADELPPLPHGAMTLDYLPGQHFFTADQMRAYARAALAGMRNG
jgi:hypothetical protein